MDEPDISAFDLDYALTGAEQERYDAMTDEQARYYEFGYIVGRRGAWRDLARKIVSERASYDRMQPLEDLDG